MRANTQQQTQVHTESSDVGTGLTADPEHTKMSVIIKLVELALVNGSDTQLSLDGRDQRWTLEESTSKGLKSSCELCLTTWELVVKSDHTNVFLSGSLLRLHESGRAIDTDDQATSNLGIKSSTVSSLLHSAQVSNRLDLPYFRCLPEHSLDPCYDFVGRRVGRLVEVDHTGGDV